MRLPRPKLSFRMKSFLEHAIPHQPFWDICCDHGYVGIRALESSRFSAVHFVDQVPHIMERVELLIQQSAVMSSSAKYILYPTSGERIEVVVEGTLLIAGVGGLTIKNILFSLIEKDILKAQRLLLSPHTDVKVIVQYLESEDFKNRYGIKEKLMLPEGKRERPLYILDIK